MKTITKLLFFVLIIFTFLVVSCNSKERKYPVAKKSKYSYAMQLPEDSLPKLDPKEVKKKQRAIEQFFTDNWGNDFENVSFLVAQNGQIIFEKYEGFADKEHNILNSPETPLHLASVSKVLTASAILRLINDKKFGLNDKVTTILKDFPYADVDIKSLLNHRSGIKKYGNFLERETKWGRTKTITNQDIYDLMISNKIKQEYPSNTHFAYCNTNYIILALIIEKVTKMKYNEAMKQIIFEPLNMKNTFVFDENTPKEKGTPSYRDNYSKFAFDYLDAVYGDKNIYSTPRDLMQFDLARNDPKFLNKTLRAQLYKGYSNEKEGNKNYGLGIRMTKLEGGQKIYFHNGWWHGNTSSYTPLIKEKALIIALSNKFTHKTYQLKRLSVLFGNYPYKLKIDTVSVD